MGKTSFWEQRLRYNLGIHEQPNFAQADHVRDCRNVWAPEGEVISRPGSEPINVKFLNHELIETAPTQLVAHYYNGSSYTTAVSGASDLTLTGFAPGHYLYIGADTSDITTTLVGYQWKVGQVNSELISLHWEYYNGSAWVALTSAVLLKDLEISTTPELCGGTAEDRQRLLFWLPSDAADFALNDGSNTYTKRYVRARNLVGTVTNPTRLDIGTAADSLLLEIDTEIETTIGTLQVVEEIKKVMMICGWESDYCYKVGVQHGVGKEAGGPADVSSLCDRQVERVASRTWIPETGEAYHGVGIAPVGLKYETGDTREGYPRVLETETHAETVAGSWSETVGLDLVPTNLVLMIIIRGNNNTPYNGDDPTAATLGGKAFTKLTSFYDNTLSTSPVLWAGYLYIPKSLGANLSVTWGKNVEGYIHLYELGGISQTDPLFDSDGGYDVAVGGSSPWTYNAGEHSSSNELTFASAPKGLTFLVAAKSTINPSTASELSHQYTSLETLTGVTYYTTAYSYYKKAAGYSEEYPSWEIFTNNHFYSFLGFSLKAADTRVFPAEVQQT